MNKHFVVLFFLIGFLSCKEKPKAIAISEKNNNTSLGFENAMVDFMKDYPGQNILTDSTKTYENAFILKEKIYYSGLIDIILEYRSLNNISDASGGVIYVYNDSVSFILPCFDEQNYRTNAIAKGKKVADFGKGFTNLITKLKIDMGSSEVLEIANLVMDLQKMQPAYREIDFKAMILRVSYNIRNAHPGCSRCLDQLLNRIRIYDSENKIMYSNGILIYLFHKPDKEARSFTILNPECYDLFNY